MLQEALDHLIRGIVSYPGDVFVSERNGSRGETLKVRVNPEDVGRVIGRNGRNINALRTVINAIAGGNDVRIDILDRY
jgi:predicted RNA-binding protein YlqC (UPF0109 family)